MEDVVKELEEYLSRGFPAEIALAKVLSHRKAQGIPGVWRAVLKTVEIEKEVRRDIIRSVPPYVREEVRELLACTRKAVDMRGEGVSWGWLGVFRYDPETLEALSPGIYYVKSMNEELPKVLGASQVWKVDEYDTVIQVERGRVALLRTRSSDLEMQDFEVIGLLTYHCPFLLEVRISERGNRAIEALERKIVREEPDKLIIG